MSDQCNWETPYLAFQCKYLLLVEVATPEYLPDKNVYIFLLSRPTCTDVFQQSNLWHIGALHGYSYTDGFLLSLKATMPL